VKHVLEDVFPDQVENADLGNLLDLLIATNCLCAIAPPLYESRGDRANYVQYEYFNYHTNKTVSTLSYNSGTCVQKPTLTTNFSSFGTTSA